MCAAFGDEPGKNLEILIGQMVNLLRDGAADADVQARRHRRHARRPRRGDRRRRQPLRAGSLPHRLADRHRPRPVVAKATNDNPVYTVQYAHARVASLLRNAADLGVEAGLAPRAARRTRRRASCCARSPSSRAWSRRRPSCASRTGSRATSRSWPAPTTGSTTRAGCCRAATRRPATCTAPGCVLVDATRTVLANGLAPARRLRPRADVTRAHLAPVRLGARRRRPAGPVLAARAQRPQRDRPAALVEHGARRPTACSASAASR